MSFAPNRTETIEKSLVNRTDLRYMPTYENNQEEYLVQIFISEDFINSMILSFSDEKMLNQLITENASQIGNTN